jgi:hypothetical protein
MPKLYKLCNKWPLSKVDISIPIGYDSPKWFIPCTSVALIAHNLLQFFYVTDTFTSSYHSYQLHEINLVALKMEAAHSSETSEQCLNSDDCQRLEIYRSS